MTRIVALFLGLVIANLPAFAQVSVRDDLGRSVQVKTIAQRIVTLAPFLTELAFAAGAGDRVVGVGAQSEFPPQVTKLPQLASGAGFSLEQLAVLKPDLVLAWSGGIRREDVERISGFGATVFVAQARTLSDVPRLLTVIGVLTGRDVTQAVTDYEAKIEKLRRDYARRTRVSAFLEIWNRPLTTISGGHFMNEALDICSADNVFKDLTGFAPQVTMEEVQEKNPFVIVGAGSAANAEEFRANWMIRQALPAVKAERLLFVDSDAIQRPTPRTPDAVADLCAGLDRVRPSQAGQVAQPGSPASTPVRRGSSQYGM
jgi:iron complex transport system substrate-binding protein